MFMVKDEYANLKKLLRVKLKTTAKNFTWFFIVAWIMCLGNLIPTVVSILKNNPGITEYSMQDYSMSFFLGLVIVCLVFLFTYRQRNDKLSVLPQTNTTRFISSQILDCIFAAVVGLTALVMYLLNYGVLKLLTLFKDNIYFTLKFDAGFIITGFITFIVYSFLFISLFGLIGVILRKWKYYAVMASIAILSLMIVNLHSVIEYFSKILAFLIKEPVPVWFIIKGVSLTLAITAVSLVINFYTVYHKSNGKINTIGIVAIIAIAVIITIIVPVILLYTDNTEPSIVFTTYEPDEPEGLSSEDYYSQFTEIRIDVSHLPKGSKLNTNIANINKTEYLFNVSGEEELNNLQGDTIIILYRFPNRSINGYNLYEYGNQSFTAYLDGDTLHIEYAYEDSSVIILPVWGIAGQFDCYKDKGILPKTPWGFSEFGSSPGYILIKSE